MKKLTNYLVTSLISFFATLWLLSFILPAAVDSFSVKSFDQLYSPSPILHFSYNSYLLWSVDPTVVALAQAINSISKTALVASPILLLLALFASGLSALLLSLGYRQAVAVALSLGLSALLLLTFGADHVLFSSLAWLSWFIFAFLLAIKDKRSSIAGLILLALTSALVLRSALQFTLFFVAAGVLLAVLLQRGFDLPFKLEAKTQRGIIFLLLLLSVVSSVALRENFEIPSYPKTGHVVSDDNVPGDLVALVGEVSDIAFVNREFVRSVFSCASLCLFALTAILFLIAHLSVDGKSGRQLFFMPLASFLLVLLDTLPTEALSQIMPLSALSRIVSGATFYPLSVFFFLFGVLGLFFAVLKLSLRISAIILAGAVLLLVVLNYQNERVIFERQGHRALASSISALGVWLEPGEDRIVFSPSYNVIATEGIELLLQPERYRNRSFNYLPDLATTQSADINPQVLFDRNDATRWSKSGGQKGSEEFCLSFNKDVTIAGIELVLGSFASDFPRGIEIVKVADCFQSTGETLYRRPRWEGPVQFTEKGFPYWGWQGDVKIVFPRNAVVRNVKVRQIGQDPAFDWSVAEVKFLVP